MPKLCPRQNNRHYELARRRNLPVARTVGADSGRAQHFKALHPNVSRDVGRETWIRSSGESARGDKKIDSKCGIEDLWLGHAISGTGVSLSAGGGPYRSRPIYGTQEFGTNCCRYTRL